MKKSILIILFLLSQGIARSQELLGKTQDEVKADPALVKADARWGQSKWGEHCEILQYHFPPRDVQYLFDKNDRCFMIIFYGKLQAFNEMLDILKMEYTIDKPTGEWTSKKVREDGHRVKALLAQDHLVDKWYIKYWLAKN